MAVNIQIFGRKKCRETKKAEMYFKERRQNYSLVDLDIKPLSPGEMQNIVRSLGSVDALINTEADYYKKKLQFLVFNAEDEIVEHPEIVKTPIIRINKKAFCGFNPDEWQELLKG